MHLRAEEIWIIWFFPVILTSHIAGGRSMYWTPRLKIKFMVVYGVNVIFSIVWDLGFSLLFFYFPSGNSRVGRSHNSQILAAAALRILLILEGPNKSYPPFLLITKYSTVSLICTLSSTKKLWLMFSISLC